MFLTPMPSPKYHRYADMWEGAVHAMKRGATEVNTKPVRYPTSGPQVVTSTPKSQPTATASLFLPDVSPIPNLQLSGESSGKAVSTAAYVRNATKRFWHPTHDVRGNLTGWKIDNALFSPDGVHLSVSGVEVLVNEICLALQQIPRFGFEMKIYEEYLFMKINSLNRI